MMLFITALVFGMATMTNAAGVEEFNLEDTSKFDFPGIMSNKTSEDKKTGAKTRSYTLPAESGYRLYDAVRASFVGHGDVTCTCNKESGGCNPDQAGNCYMTSCSACSKTNSAVMLKAPDGESDIRFIQSKSALADNLPSTSKQLFDVLPVKQAIENFNKKYREYLVDEESYCKDKYSCEAREGHVFVAVNVYGSTTYVPMKEEITRFTSVGMVVVRKLSCSCNTNGACPMDSTWGHKYCDAANCQSCTMHGAAYSVKRHN